MTERRTDGTSVFKHTYGWARRLLLLDPAREGEVDGDLAARQRGGGSSGIQAGLRQGQAGRKRCHGREGGARARGAAPMRLPTIYKGGGGWFLALQVHWGVGKGGGKKSHHFPSPPIVIPLF